jgi:hypothetical protein
LKKIILLSALSLLLLGAGNAFAFAPLLFDSWGAGVHASHIKYDEPSFMEEKGYMFGIDGSYTFRKAYMFKAEGRLSYGKINYSSPVSGTKSDIDDILFEFRALLGYDFRQSKTVYTPYSGFGYRYLFDDLRGTTSTGAVGYRRKANYYYIPLGLETTVNLSPDWAVALILEYDYFLGGIQKTLLSDTGLGWGDIENDQDNGYGYRTSVKIYKADEGSYYVLEPYFIYWNIEDSDLVPIPGSGGSFGIEPANTSMEFGLKLGVIFR